jgi:hypothetical protein
MPSDKIFWGVSRLNKKFIFSFIVFSFLALSLSFGPKAALASMLYFSPSSGNQTAGNILNVSVYVNTQGKAINNAEASIRFPTALLEVVSISKSGSIFTLWVEEPRFSNSAGTISFNGGLPTPGFTGSAGRVVTIAFRVKSAGSASLLFTSGAVRANDGLGTDVLSSMGTATFTISPAPVIPVPEPTPIPVPSPTVVDEPIVEDLPYTPPKPAELVVEEHWSNRIIDSISNFDYSLKWMIVFIILLIILLMYGRSRFVRLRSGVRKETYDVEKVLHHSFDTIKEDIVACVGLLERAKNRRHLTEEERAVVSLLKQHLRETERLVTKEIHDIRRHTEK